MVSMGHGSGNQRLVQGEAERKRKERMAMSIVIGAASIVGSDSSNCDQSPPKSSLEKKKKKDYQGG